MLEIKFLWSLILFLFNWRRRNRRKSCLLYKLINFLKLCLIIIIIANILAMLLCHFLRRSNHLLTMVMIIFKFNTQFRFKHRFWWISITFNLFWIRISLSFRFTFLLILKISLILISINYYLIFFQFLISKLIMSLSIFVTW